MVTIQWGEGVNDIKTLGANKSDTVYALWDSVLLFIPEEMAEYGLQKPDGTILYRSDYTLEQYNLLPNKENKLYVVKVDLFNPKI